MWQAPNSRAHSIAAARKRARDRVKNSVHIKRVHADVKVAQVNGANIGDVRIILNDFTPKGVGIFAGKALPVGQTVSITLQLSRQIYVRGTVIDCHEQSNHSHVISDQRYSYRIMIKFVFETEEEREQLTSFCDSIQREHIRPQAA